MSELINTLEPVMQAVEQAHGLPNEHYTSETVFETEKRTVLFANWTGVGFAKDIPNSGDAKPITFLGMPLLMVRSPDGAVNVFQNTCRHRGMILVEESKNIRKVIRCPYHSWCYDLNGDLKTTPHVGGPGQNTHEAICKEELGLFKIRSTIWHDVVFVNIDGLAAPFEEVHKDLMQRWEEFEQPSYHGGPESSFKLNVNTNWKLAVENYCESYHLPWVHPGLNSYSRLEDHYHIEGQPDYSGQGTLVYQQLVSEQGDKLTDFKGLSEQWDKGAEYVSLYPNVLLGVHRDHRFSIVLEPMSTEQTLEHIELYFAETPEVANNSEPLRHEISSLWKTIFKEDIFVVEGMQRGRHGEHFDGGRFSPAMDSPTHNFHHWVASNISSKA